MVYAKPWTKSGCPYKTTSTMLMPEEDKRVQCHSATNNESLVEQYLTQAPECQSLNVVCNFTVCDGILLEVTFCWKETMEAIYHLIISCMYCTNECVNSNNAC